MNVTIGPYDSDGNTVPVTFTAGEVTVTRDVNACRTALGEYDLVATQRRVAQVALGVQAKIALGVVDMKVSNQPTVPTFVPTGDDDV